MALKVETNGMVMVLDTDTNMYRQYQYFIEPDGTVRAEEVVGMEQQIHGTEPTPQIETPDEG